MQLPFKEHNLNNFKTYEEAYHQLMVDIIAQQIISLKLVLNEAIKKIFVDGGFAENSIYMNLLAHAFPHIKIFAADTSQASALGAAIAIHKHWNQNQLPVDLVSLKRFPFSPF